MGYDIRGRAGRSMLVAGAAAALALAASLPSDTISGSARDDEHPTEGKSSKKFKKNLRTSQKRKRRRRK